MVRAPPLSETLRGEVFDGVTAAATPVTVVLDGAGSLRIRGPTGERAVPFAECVVSPALGRSPRTIALPGGARIVTMDLDLLADWELRWARGAGGRLRDSASGSWRWALGALVVIVAACVATYVWGIPLAARGIAFGLPASVNASLGDHALSTLEHLLRMEPSAVPPERQATLREEFAVMVADLGTEGFRYELQFRKSAALGANAIALPSGTILVTDGLVELAQSDEEVLSVLAHEITHVEQRHGTRSVLQSSGVFLLLGSVLGDITSVTSLGASLPTLLAESRYSRDFEREADRGAADYARSRGWGTGPLRAMLERLEQQDGGGGPSWISSHPETAERIAALNG